MTADEVKAMSIPELREKIVSLNDRFTKIRPETETARKERYDIRIELSDIRSQMTDEQKEGLQEIFNANRKDVIAFVGQLIKDHNNHHSRYLRDGRGIAHDIVFDRFIVDKKDIFPNCAIVTDPVLKAELLFVLGPDPDYPESKTVYEARDYASFLNKNEKRELKEVYIKRHRKEIKDPLVASMVG